MEDSSIVEECEHLKSRKTAIKGMRLCNECEGVFFVQTFEERKDRPSPWPKFIKHTLLYTTISLGTVLGMIYVRALILGLT